MKKMTYEEIEKLGVIEINNLCEKYGMSIRTIKTFTYKQKLAFLHGKINK